jgi:hypothetical protein
MREANRAADAEFSLRKCWLRNPCAMRVSETPQKPNRCRAVLVRDRQARDDFGITCVELRREHGSLSQTVC